MRRQFALSIPLSLLACLAWIVDDCLAADNTPDNYDDVFDTSYPLMDSVPDSTGGTDDISLSMTPGAGSDIFLNSDETSILGPSHLADFGVREDDSYLFNDALVTPDSFGGADVGTPSDTTRFQLAEGTLCPGVNRQLWCCQIPNQAIGCIPYDGERIYDICSRRYQHCCSQNFETKEAYDCEKLYPSTLERVLDFFKGIGGPGGDLAPGGGGGGFFGLPDLQ